MRGWRSPGSQSWSAIRFAGRSATGPRLGETWGLCAVSALVTACTVFAPIYHRAMEQALVDTLLSRAFAVE